MITDEIVKDFFEMVDHIKDYATNISPLVILSDNKLDDIKSYCNHSSTIFDKKHNIKLDIVVDYSIMIGLDISIDPENKYKKLMNIWEKYRTWENYNKNKMLEEIERI